MKIHCNQYSYSSFIERETPQKQSHPINTKWNLQREHFTAHSNRGVSGITLVFCEIKVCTWLLRPGLIDLWYYMSDEQKKIFLVRLHRGTTKVKFCFLHWIWDLFYGNLGSLFPNIIIWHQFFSIRSSFFAMGWNIFCHILTFYM